MAAVECECGRLRRAERFAERAAASAQRLGAEQHFVVCDVLRTLGALEAEAGDLATAEGQLETALDLAVPGRPTFALLALVELAAGGATRGPRRGALPAGSGPSLHPLGRRVAASATRRCTRAMDPNDSVR